MKKKIRKSKYGYIDSMRFYSVLKALIMFAVSFTVLAIGWIRTGSKENVLTVVAILGVLPACKWTVNAIMHLRFRSGSRAFYEKSRSITEQYGIDERVLFYDSVLTTETQGSHQINMFACIEGCLIGYSEFEKTGCSIMEKHLRTMLKKNSISKISVKIFDEENAFLTRYEDLAAKYTESAENEFEAIALVGALSL